MFKREGAVEAQENILSGISDNAGSISITNRSVGEIYTFDMTYAVDISSGRISTQFQSSSGTFT